MIILLNMGRLLMAAWIVYGLLIIFAPSILHRPPDQTSGIVQVIVAYALGYLMDRALSVVRRRRAALSVGGPPSNDAGSI
jgi:hypothetical protein